MKRFLYCLFITLLFHFPSIGQEKKVAVVLGGGGAKGVAHIGVLKVLEEAGMPIDYVVGTSMGAIVGGLYAIGYDALTIDSMVRMQDWTMLLSDRVRRNSLTFPEKENSERYILSLPFGRNKRDILPGGVIKGQNLHNLFSNLTVGYHDNVDFRKLPIPFAAVAVDLVSGEDYIFQSGSIPLAMRASMAIPAVFTPVRLDSTVLIDGGINNNYPVDVAKRLGADLVIGVDLGTSDLKLLEGINTPGDVVGQIIALHGYEKYSQNKENTDLLLRPDMTPYNSASFHPVAIDTMIWRGEQEARRHWEEILALRKEALGATDTGRFPQEKSSAVHPSDTFYIRNILFEGTDPRDESWLLKISGLKENSRISVQQLQNAISILMGANSYSHVSYKLTGEEPYDLLLMVQEKSNTSINLGIRFDTEEIAAVLLNGTFDYRSHARTKLSVTGRIGKSGYGRVDYGIERNPMRNINLAYMFRYQNLDIHSRGEKILNTNYTHHMAELAYSDMNWLNFKVKVGLRYEYFNYNSFLYKGGFDTYNVKPEGYISYFGLAHLETLDRRYFPNRGVSLQAYYSMYTDNFVGYNGKSPFSAAGLGFTSVIPLRSRLTLLPSIYGRVLIGGNLAYPFLNAVGGEVPHRYLPQQLPFAGINHIEIFDNAVGIIRLHLRQRLWSRHYISLIGNYAVHHNDVLSILNGKHVWGGSIGYAYNSFAGPVNTSISVSNWNKSAQFYLNIGYNF